MIHVAYGPEIKYTTFGPFLKCPSAASANNQRIPPSGLCPATHAHSPTKDQEGGGRLAALQGRSRVSKVWCRRLETGGFFEIPGL